MDPIITPIVCGVVALFGGFGGAMYIPQRDEWNKTFRRAAVVARSHLGGKPLETVVIQKRLSSDGLEEFTAVLEGKADTISSSRELAIVQPKLHTITRSWNALKDGGEGVDDLQEQWWWECKCGEKKWRKTKEGAKESARLHIKTFGGRNKDEIKEEGWFNPRWENRL